MYDFKAGDEVVCIRDNYREGTTGPLPVKGNIYVVIEVRPAMRTDGSLGPATIFLTDAWWDCWNGKGGFGPDRFRKVQKRDLQAWLSTAVKADKWDKRKVKA